MNASNVGIGIALALGLGAAQAQADTIIQTASYGPVITNWASEPLTFSGFDSGLGTLTGITVTVTENASGTLTNTNSGNTATTVTSKIENSWDAILPSTLSSVAVLSGSSLSGAAKDLLDAGAAGPTHTVSGSSHASVASTNVAEFAAYESSFTISADDTGYALVSSDDSNGTARYSDQGQVTATVTYTYDPTPVAEPASLALLGTALFGFGSIRRRR